MTQIAAVIRLCLRDPEDRDPDLRRNATTLRWLGHQWSLRSLAQTIPGVFAGAVSACVATDNAVVLKELVSEIKMDSVEDLRKIIDQCSYRPGCENAIRSWIFLLHPEIEDVSLGWRQKTLNEYAVCDGVAQPSPKVYPYHRIVRFNNSKRRKRGAPVLISPRTTPFINKRFMALFASSSSTPARKPQNDDDCE